MNEDEVDQFMGPVRMRDDRNNTIFSMIHISNNAKYDDYTQHLVSTCQVSNNYFGDRIASVETSFTYEQDPHYSGPDSVEAAKFSAKINIEYKFFEAMDREYDLVEIAIGGLGAVMVGVSEINRNVAPSIRSLA